MKLDKVKYVFVALDNTHCAHDNTEWVTAMLNHDTSSYDSENFKPLPGLKPLLSMLHSQGCDIYYLIRQPYIIPCDNKMIWVDKYYPGLFHAVIGVGKHSPKVQFIEEFICATQCKPRKILFIDDNAASRIEVSELGCQVMSTSEVTERYASCE